MRAIVTGANRGIGLELTLQLLEQGHRVEATARAPDEAKALRGLDHVAEGRLLIHQLDISTDESVAAFAEGLDPGPIDLLINNAGVMGGGAPNLEALDTARLLETFNVNALGALRMTGAVLPRLREAGRGAKVVNITSQMGSIDDNTSGGAYGYRMSKAALNMATRSMGHDLMDAGILAVALHPGWVQTDMGGGGARKPVKESARQLLAVIEGLKPEQSGGFFNYAGDRLPW